MATTFSVAALISLLVSTKELIPKEDTVEQPCINEDVNELPIGPADEYTDEE